MEYETLTPFEFTGDAKTYFRIWVVNTFLSIVTLGIYSAWAKVRSQRYFYSHLNLDGSGFEYHANPLGILLGRVIAVVLFSIYLLTSRYWPDFSLWFLLLLVPVLPWIVRSSLRFRARNSSWRNIRFRFDGSYRSALNIVGILPAIIYGPLVVLNALAAPYLVTGTVPRSFGLYYGVAVVSALVFLGIAMHAYYDYVVTGSNFGNSRFEFRSTRKEYYGLITILFLATLGMAIVVSILAFLTILLGSQILDGSDSIIQSFRTLATAGLGIVMYVFIIGAFGARTTNLLYNGIVIPGWYTFRSDVTISGLFNLYLQNSIMIIVTLGLYIPFAKIRMINYRAEHLRLIATAPMDQFESHPTDETSAVGQEVGEMFDFGLSL